jgi:UDP:flavonoid glycosyltransferase YjiC (YdhE family)
MMRIVIMALGSRGDVQPYLALGKGLERAGHEVRLVSNSSFEKLVTGQGLAFWPMRGNMMEVVESEEMRALLDKGNFLAIQRKTAKEAQRAMLKWAEDGLAACQGMELIITGYAGLFIGLALAEKLSLRLLQAYLVPFTPTQAFPGVLLPKSVSRLGGAANRFSHHLVRQIMWQGARSADKVARQQVLGLPPAPFWGPYRNERLRGLPILYGFSPSVIPKPADWGEHIHITGYWFLEEAADWTPPADLAAFLENGSKPVYIGFGSMGSRKPEETTDLVVHALGRSGQRAVLASGWGGLRKADLPDSVYMLDSIPHSWLFPRVTAVVHHGGAGTTAAGMRAGAPSIITPFFADQPFWGQRVADLGVGVEPIPRQQLTVERLADAIQQAVSDTTMCRRAADLGRRIQAEDGVARAVEVINRV